MTTALLHRENPERLDFAVQEIKARARQEAWGQTLRPGFNQHAVYHCLANKAPNHVDHRMLFETGRGRKRLYRPGDPHHPDRANGKIRPDKWEIPSEYQPLVDWYETVYAKQRPQRASLGANDQSGFQGEGNAAKSPPAMSEMQSGTVFVSPEGAVVIPSDLRTALGIEEGTRISIYREHDRLVLQPITKEFIHSLVGCLKGEDSLVEAWEREHRIEKDRMAR